MQTKIEDGDLTPGIYYQTSLRISNFVNFVSKIDLPLPASNTKSTWPLKCNLVRNKNLNELNNVWGKCCSYFQVDLPLIDGTYKWADGKSIGVLDCTVVVIETDKGVTG